MASAIDKVFLNSERYIDHVDYRGETLCQLDAAEDAKDKYEEVRDAIFDLMLDGKLNQTDIAIINARNCSPMPSMREVAAQLKINIERVHTRVKRIISLMPKDLQKHFNRKSNATPSYR